MARHAQAFETSGLLRVIRIFNTAGVEARGSWQPALPLEMAYVESLQGIHGPQEEAPETAPVKAARPKARAKPQPSADETPEPPHQAGESASEEGGEEAAEDTPASRRIWENWQQILTQVRQQNPKTYGLLNSCKSRSFKNGILVLGFASDLLKHQMEKSDNVELVVGILKQVTGVEVAVRCQTKMGKSSDLPPNVDTDGMVATALHDLGGEIVDIQ